MNASGETNLKVLLATPIATKKDLWGQYRKGAGAYLPLGLLSIAGVVREAGYDVQLHDASTLGTEEAEFREYLRDGQFDVIGLGGCYTALAHLVFRTAKICRDVLPDAKIVAGGVHPTLFPVETLQACQELDFVVHGEGEHTFVELLRTLTAGREELAHVHGIAYRHDGQPCQTPPRPPIAELGALPRLPFDLVEVERYVPPPSNYLRLPTYGLMVQRGCPYRCVYCDGRVHGLKVRHDDIDKLIAEMRYLVDRHGMRGLIFHDSAFTVSMSFAERLCKRMIDEGLDLSWTCYTRVDKVNPDLLALMKRAGCWSISYGLESANPESLELIRKGTTIEQAEQAVRWTRQAGMHVIASFIICLPGEDETMVLNTVNFAKSLKLDTAVFFLPVPFPGTGLYDLCKADGGLVADIKWEDYKQWMEPSNPLYINPRIGQGRMVKLYDYAVRSFYTSPRTIPRHALHVRSLSDLWKYMKAVRSIADIVLRPLKRNG